MKTVWGETLRPECVLQEYPRPQMKRESYVNLNGLWDYAITDTKQRPTQWQGKILVPFSPETELSGVQKTLMPGQYLWYRRTVVSQGKGRVLLHFGAVDQQAEVFVNDRLVGSHVGGFTAFTLELTSVWQEENEVLVCVRDDTDTSIHSTGKQRLKHGDIWYPPQSGIWQTVWLEYVPEVYIKQIQIRPLFDEKAVQITVISEKNDACAILFDGRTLEGKTNEPLNVSVKEFHPWSPEEPYLYPFAVQLGEDRVESYFAMRKVEVKQDAAGVPRIYLNGEAYFMNGLLDQGYWSDGMYTAPGDEALIYDIETAKALGFNTLRKHIKIEPMRWYYHCDRLGMLVWQDMPSGGSEAYKFMTISAPLVTKIHCKDHRYKQFSRMKEESRAQYSKELWEMIVQLYNVPSIVLWCPFNEGWGQFDAKKAVDTILELDDTRLIDHASGWHDQGIGAFQSVHSYFVKYRFKKDKKGRAVILSEFGGYNHQVEGHCMTGGNRYRGYKTQRALLEQYRKLMLGQILPAKEKGLAAAIYTQLSDVENEVNGMLTYDRKVVKLPALEMEQINGRLR